MNMPDEARLAYAQVMAGLLADENPGVRLESIVTAERPDDGLHTAIACRQLERAGAGFGVIAATAKREAELDLASPALRPEHLALRDLNTAVHGREAEPVVFGLGVRPALPAVQADTAETATESLNGHPTTFAERAPAVGLDPKFGTVRRTRDELGQKGRVVGPGTLWKAADNVVEGPWETSA